MLTRKLKGIFADSACTPSPPEEIWVPPISIDQGGGTVPEGSGSVAIFPRVWPCDWNFVISVDDNNDPFNKDTTDLWMEIYYLYELPSRPFPARYDLGIREHFDVEINSRSNHVFGSHWWRGWVNGFLALEVGGEGEVYALPDSSLPLYHVKEWGKYDRWGYHKNALLERSVVLEPNQSLRARLALVLFVRIDRGVAVGTGSYTIRAAKEFYDPHEAQPDLRCIITPEW